MNRRCRLTNSRAKLPPFAPIISVRPLTSPCAPFARDLHGAYGARAPAADFALGALLLTVMGLFGVVSSSVTRRRHELALRLELAPVTVPPAARLPRRCGACWWSTYGTRGVATCNCAGPVPATSSQHLLSPALLANFNARSILRCESTRSSQNERWRRERGGIG
jgi:hypothetical protein